MLAAAEPVAALLRKTGNSVLLGGFSSDGRLGLRPQELAAQRQRAMALRGKDLLKEDRKARAHAARKQGAAKARAAKAAKAAKAATESIRESTPPTAKRTFRAQTPATTKRRRCAKTPVGSYKAESSEAETLVLKCTGDIAALQRLL